MTAARTRSRTQTYRIHSLLSRRPLGRTAASRFVNDQISVKRVCNAGHQSSRSMSRKVTNLSCEVQIESTKWECQPVQPDDTGGGFRLGRLGLRLSGGQRSA